MTKLTQVLSVKCFGGLQKVYQLESEQLKVTTKFTIFLPPSIAYDDKNPEPASKETKKLPVLFYLAGLASTEQNLITKTGFQRYAADLDLVVIGIDTSPRDTGVPGEDESEDIGTGASMYLDATVDPWATNYRMYSFFLKELIPLIEAEFQYIEKGNYSIFGHSMGGHGALVLALKNPGLFKSVGGLAPVSNPCRGYFCSKLLRAYLGDNEDTWKMYDATELVKSYDGPKFPIRIDLGAEDQVMHELKVTNFVDEAKQRDFPIEYHYHEGYEHSYYFVSTFIGPQMKFHADVLHGK